MTDQHDTARSPRAVFTVTVESRQGPAYFDRDGFVLHAVSRIEGALEDSDDIRDVTIAEAVPADPAAPDLTALRDRIAEALHRQLPGCAHDGHGHDCAALADAVLAVLPARTIEAPVEAYLDFLLGNAPCPDLSLLPLPRREVVTVRLGSVNALVGRGMSAPVDRAVEEHRLALSDALGLGTGAPWDAIHDRVTELGLPPLDQDPVARRLGLVAEHRATVLTEAADAVFALDYDEMVSEQDDENLGSLREAWDLGTIHATELLRRLAAEATPEPATHSCRNCDGIDPDTCFTNPNRPPEQCSESEFDGYGRQCEKPAGHNLCTFEEEPTAVVEPQPDDTQDEVTS